MRIVVMSDTHGNYPLAIRALDAAGDFDLIVHLGDEVGDAEFMETATGRAVIKISGNCDRGSMAPREQCLVFNNFSFFMTHGDIYRVKSGLSFLHEKALSERAQVVLYGHSHRAVTETIDGILYVNPGAMKKEEPAPSYAVVTLAGPVPRADIFLLA